jgi:hypothetical protein
MVVLPSFSSIVVVVLLLKILFSEIKRTTGVTMKIISKKVIIEFYLGVTLNGNIKY